MVIEVNEKSKYEATGYSNYRYEVGSLVKGAWKILSRTDNGKVSRFQYEYELTRVN